MSTETRTTNWWMLEDWEGKDVWDAGREYETTRDAQIGMAIIYVVWLLLCFWRSENHLLIASIFPPCLQLLLPLPKHTRILRRIWRHNSASCSSSGCRPLKGLDMLHLTSERLVRARKRDKHRMYEARAHVMKQQGRLFAYFWYAWAWLV